MLHKPPKSEVLYIQIPLANVLSDHNPFHAATPTKRLKVGTEGSFQKKDLEKLLITLLITEEKVNTNLKNKISWVESYIWPFYSNGKFKNLDETGKK